jgi:hypothetical protein
VILSIFQRITACTGGDTIADCGSCNPNRQIVFDEFIITPSAGCTFVAEVFQRFQPLFQSQVMSCSSFLGVLILSA